MQEKEKDRGISSTYIETKKINGRQHKLRMIVETEKQTSQEDSEQSLQARLERLHMFPALINKIWPGLRSAHCSSSTTSVSHTHTLTASILVLKDMA